MSPFTQKHPRLVLATLAWFFLILALLVLNITGVIPDKVFGLLGLCLVAIGAPALLSIYSRISRTTQGETSN